MNDDWSIDEIKRDIEQENFVSIPNFGIYHLSIRQAAELISIDMWYSGEIDDVGEPEDWDGSEYDPKLVDALAKYVQEFETRLLTAVELERLKAVSVKRNLDELIISDETYIEFEKLREWLNERGYDGGDIINCWTFAETDIAVAVSKEVNYLRAAIKENGTIPKKDDDFQTMYKKTMLDNQSLKNENQQLKKQISELQSHQEKLNKPVSTKARKSFLLIIEALCKKNNIDSQERSMAGKIQRIVELQTGQKIDDDTVRNILNQIPDALN